MEIRKLVKELRSNECRCGKWKAKRKTFCKACYFALPANLRKALYNRIGEGYEDAYMRSCEFLGRKGS